MIRVDTEYGQVAVKILEFDKKMKLQPEYDDCIRAAEEHDIPLAEVTRAAVKQAEIQEGLDK